jgi:putative hydrolase
MISPHPADVLDRIATMLERRGTGRYREQAFRRAADAVRDLTIEELSDLAAHRALTSVRSVGEVTAGVIEEVLAVGRSEYLSRLEKEAAERAGPAEVLCDALVGDLHCHSNWSDGGGHIDQMARKAAAIGHCYLALTDHSPRLSIAKGLTTDRLLEQLDVVAQLNRALAPFHILTGIEVDILDDGSLDQTDEMLQQLDIVVASVHSQLRMPGDAMTARMVRAIANPHTDILGHCTGRIVVGRGRPESDFDAAAVFDACLEEDKAVEINCRPDRLDPPSRLLELAARRRVKVAINTDAHAVGQLDWQLYGCVRAIRAGIAQPDVVNTWPLDDLMSWARSHEVGAR